MRFFWVKSLRFGVSMEGKQSVVTEVKGIGLIVGGLSGQEVVYAD